MPTPRSLLGADGLRAVSPRLIPARYLAAIPGHVIALVLAGACAWVALTFDGWWWLWIVAAVVLATRLPGLFLTPRRVRALGYLDREEDLVTASGIMFRSVTITPYGRVQSVELHEGPIERRYGIARISFSTASSDADGSIPGLPREEAERLRDLLTRRGIERMQSL